MRLNPARRQATPAYPNLMEHATDRRTFLGLLGQAAAVAGLAACGLSAACAGEPADDTGDLAKQVALLAGQLGNEDAKVRKAATTKLIEIGKGTGKETAADAKGKKIVVAQVEPLLKDKDPEVAERAKAIVLAVNPPPPPEPPDEPVQVMGDIAQ